LKGAKFISKKVNEDVYYDNDVYALTSNDIWLRKRNGKFELKMPVENGSRGAISRYRKITDEGVIKKILKLDSNKGLEVALNEAGYKPSASFKTTRRRYQKGEFTIDIDEANFGDQIYRICEIELKVKTPAEVKSAEERIVNFAYKHGLKIIPVRGKIIEYLRRKNFEHYAVLIASKVVENFD
jgi:adenylate cyclase class IV